MIGKYLLLLSLLFTRPLFSIMTNNLCAGKKVFIVKSNAFSKWDCLQLADR
jgi:hypothetical protein